MLNPSAAIEVGFASSRRNLAPARMSSASFQPKVIGVEESFRLSPWPR